MSFVSLRIRGRAWNRRRWQRTRSDDVTLASLGQGANVRRSTWFTVTALTAMFVAGCSSSGPSSSNPRPSPASSAETSSSPASPATVASRPSDGCRTTAIAPPGETTLKLSAGGEQGTYIRHLPPSYDGRQPLPLVIDLHGYAEAAVVHTRISGLGAYGDGHHFITVTPETNGPVPHWSTELNGADVAFIGGLMDTAERTLCIDQARIYVTGYSNGAFMTSAIACKYADRVAAVAPVAGIQEITGCTFSRPVPVVTFHGTSDPFVPYDGGIGKAALNLPAPDGSGKTLGELGTTTATRGPSIPQATAAWAKRNGCQPTPANRTVASGVTLISYGCPADAEVELYRVTDGGHAWPGSQVDKSLEKVVGSVTMSISANEIMWAFFEQHPLS
jgi:polyhydroxybutyrate depolymerase